MKFLTGAVNWFTKITGWPVQFCCFRTRIYYEDRKVQGRRLPKGSILISNHTAVYDYAVWLFVFAAHTVRFQMAEVLFGKKVLGPFLRAMGGIKVDRGAHSLDSLDECAEIIRRGGRVGIFPEGRIPLKGEERPLPFRVGAACLALMTGAPVVPAVTDGSYFRRERAHVLIGKPIHPSEIISDPEGGGAGDRENIEKLNLVMRERIRELSVMLEKMKSGGSAGQAPEVSQ